MALLRARSGEWLSLAPTSYQFPDPAKLEREYDANWLTIKLDAALAGLEWSASDPALTTWELESLVKWLEELTAGTLNTGDVWSALEPNLVFEAGASNSSLRNLIVELRGELRPRVLGESWEPLRVLLTATPAALRRFCAALRDESAKFPFRQAPRENSAGHGVE